MHKCMMLTVLNPDFSDRILSFVIFEHDDVTILRIYPESDATFPPKCILWSFK